MVSLIVYTGHFNDFEKVFLLKRFSFPIINLNIPILKKLRFIAGFTFGAPFPLSARILLPVLLKILLFVDSDIENQRLSQRRLITDYK